MLAYKNFSILNLNLENPKAINEDKKTTKMVVHTVTKTLFRKNLSNLLEVQATMKFLRVGWSGINFGGYSKMKDWPFNDVDAI